MVLIKISSLNVVGQSREIFQNLSFEIEKGKQYAIVGPSGSGKTMLLKCLAGQCFFKGNIEYMEDSSIVLVEQQHHFKNLSNTSSFYYQQRFNSSDTEDAVTTKQYFEEEPHSDSHSAEMFELLGINKLFDKRLIQLSNGENKRVQLAKALLQRPDILLLDNPFLGLDAEARKMLNEILDIIAKKEITIIMVTSPQLIPGFVTMVLELRAQSQFVLSGKDFFLKHHSFRPATIKIDTNLLQQLTAEEENNFGFAVRMKNVHVQYGSNVILNNINWEIKKGERWVLSGPNGAGKSTLLSLINADNPQAYANEIYLFDERRGKGESIWDIKRRIGYVSPELHLFFEFSNTAFDVVASGLFDTIGLFRTLNEEQIELVLNWMKLFHIDGLRNQRLANLPLGKQRLALLARAMVKNPPLLILDEPAQGLDEEQSSLFKSLIEQICGHSQKTLIYVTHLRDEIPSGIDHFIEIDKGSILKKTGS